MKHCRKIHVDTEVWSWGSGDRGQLGHADLLDRLPSVFRVLRFLVKTCPGMVDSGPLSQRSAHAEQYAQTKTNTNTNPDPNRYRRRCPDPNARIQKFIH